MPRPSTQATIKGRFKSEGAMGEGVMKRFTPTLRGEEGTGKGLLS
jgi:hypothetical protein